MHPKHSWGHNIQPNHRLRLHLSLHHAEQYVSCGATVKIWFCNIKQRKSAAEDTAWQDI